MTWQLLTSNTTTPTNLDQIRGLNLFSTKKLVHSHLLTVDPQAQYSKDKPLDFEPITEEEIPIPEPTRSTLYIIDELVNLETLKEVSNINFLELDAFYLDYIDLQTYIISDSSKTVSSERLIPYEDFTNNNFTYSYTFEENLPDTYTVDEILVNGLVYLPGTVEPHTFERNGQTITLIATRSCGPQPGDVFEIKLSASLEDSTDVTHELLLFDFSNEDLDFIDQLGYLNQTFQVSTVIQKNSLLYNRRINLCICVK